MRYFLIIIPLIIFSCTNPSNERKIRGLLRKYNSEISYRNKPIILIPINGCGSCVDKAINFMKKEYNKGEVVFILSALYKKEYSIKLGEELISPYIIYDTLNSASAMELVSNTPIIYFMKKKLNSMVLQTDQDYINLQNLMISFNH